MTKATFTVTLWVYGVTSVSASAETPRKAVNAVLKAAKQHAEMVAGDDFWVKAANSCVRAMANVSTTRYEVVGPCHTKSLEIERSKISAPAAITSRAA